MRKLLYIFFILIVSSNYYGQSQRDSIPFKPQYRHGINYTVKTQMGDLYTGFPVEETKDFITLENRRTRERYELRKSEIIRVSRAGDAQASEGPMGENLHPEHYLFLSSAFLFDEGKVSTNAHWLLLESIDYAISQNWAIELNTLAFYPLTLGVKCAYQLGENDYVGANIFGIGNLNSGGGGSFLWGYGALAKYTRGSSNKNFTLSGGVLGLSSDIFYSVTNSPFVNLGFVSAAYCNRLWRNVALDLEGWYLPSTDAGLAGIGFKFIGDEISCWTIGCYTLLNSYDNSLRINLKTLPIPYFGVARKFR